MNTKIWYSWQYFVLQWFKCLEGVFFYQICSHFCLLYKCCNALVLVLFTWWCFRSKAKYCYEYKIYAVYLILRTDLWQCFSGLFLYFTFSSCPFHHNLKSKISLKKWQNDKMISKFFFDSWKMQANLLLLFVFAYLQLILGSLNILGMHINVQTLQIKDWILKTLSRVHTAILCDK